MEPRLEIGPARIATDRQEIESVIEAVEAVDGHRPIGERKAIGLTQPVSELVGIVGKAEGRVVAFVALTPAANDWWAMEMAVAPPFRQHDSYRRLFEAAVLEARRRGAKSLRAWLFHPGLATAAVREGFREERQLFKMERHLPSDRALPYPAGVEIGSFRLGEDEDEWLQLNNEAFAAHPENGAWTRADLLTRMERDWFDPEMVLMAWKERDPPPSRLRRHSPLRGEKRDLVGFNWLKSDRNDGEIYVIAVSPAFQGKGLGAALISDGLNRLEKRGAERAFLYVDADNSKALRLYRGLGFYLDHVDRSFVREI